MKKIQAEEIKTDFEMGQIDALNYIKNHIQINQSEVKNINTGHFIQETKKDILYPAKLLMKLTILEAVEGMINFKLGQIEGEKNEY